MFGNNYNPYGFHPTSNAPTSVPYSNYNNQNYVGQYNQQNSILNANTNKIFVNGIEDVRNRILPANSEYIFLDNDKPLLYQKSVDSSGHFDVKVFDILPHKDEPRTSNDSTNFVLKSEFLALQNELSALKERIGELSTKKEVSNEPVEYESTNTEQQ